MSFERANFVMMSKPAKQSHHPFLQLCEERNKRNEDTEPHGCEISMWLRGEMRWEFGFVSWNKGTGMKIRRERTKTHDKCNSNNKEKYQSRQPQQGGNNKGKVKSRCHGATILKSGRVGAHNMVPHILLWNFKYHTAPETRRLVSLARFFLTFLQYSIFLFGRVLLAVKDFPN